VGGIGHQGEEQRRRGQELGAAAAGVEREEEVGRKERRLWFYVSMGRVL
jgi:hypothetical protein